MRKGDLKLDSLYKRVFIYTTALDVLGKANRPVEALNVHSMQKKREGAFWLLQQLKQQGQKHSSATYGLVMEVIAAISCFLVVHSLTIKETL
uniref:Uncharacterized protein n=1 Tax=Quercus lobata TaxID=97700 RepID=A0A7N2MVH2_QUELO